jgi:TrmH family RNA methyltransferase
MISIARIKFISSLKQKKFRQEQGFFIAEGLKLVKDLITSSFQIEEILAYKEIVGELTLASKSKEIPVVEVSPQLMSRLSNLVTPSPVLAVVKIPTEHKPLPDVQKELILFLDDLKDPGNTGTIIRLADWFGIDHVVCSEDTVELFNPKVVQATMGSIARINVHYVKTSKFFSTLTKDINIYGAFLEGENIWNATLQNNGIIVIGNESLGIGSETASFVTRKLFIPPFHSSQKLGSAESLNVTTATGIICSEFRRRAGK